MLLLFWRQLMTLTHSSVSVSFDHLGEIMERQSENVVLQEETSVEWLQREGLRVGVRLIIVRLVEGRKNFIRINVNF